MGHIGAAPPEPEELVEDDEVDDVDDDEVLVPPPLPVLELELELPPGPPAGASDEEQAEAISVAKIAKAGEAKRNGRWRVVSIGSLSGLRKVIVTSRNAGVHDSRRSHFVFGDDRLAP